VGAASKAESDEGDGSMRGFNGDSELGCFLFESFVNMKAGLKCVPTSSRLFESAFIKTGEHLFNSLAEQYLTGLPCTRAMPPPPPTPAQVTTRRNVIFAFWVRFQLLFLINMCQQAVILLGLPLWWKTTNIYRAQLPLELMDRWSDGKVRQLYTTL